MHVPQPRRQMLMNVPHRNLKVDITTPTNLNTHFNEQCVIPDAHNYSQREIRCSVNVEHATRLPEVTIHTQTHHVNLNMHKQPKLVGTLACECLGRRQLGVARRLATIGSLSRHECVCYQVAAMNTYAGGTANNWALFAGGPTSSNLVVVATPPTTPPAKAVATSGILALQIDI